jgi:hypothetical protein
MTSCSEPQRNISAENNTQNKSILSMQDRMILHAKHIYPQIHKDDVKAYKHQHGIDMQIHSIPKSPKQKQQEMEVSDLHYEEFKIFALEYNTYNTDPLMNLITTCHADCRMYVAGRTTGQVCSEIRP